MYAACGGGDQTNTDGDLRSMDTSAISRIMGDNPDVSFDDARLMLVHEQLRAAGIDPETGALLAATTGPSSRWVCGNCSFNNRPQGARRQTPDECTNCGAPRPHDSFDPPESDGHNVNTSETPQPRERRHVDRADDDDEAKVPMPAASASSSTFESDRPQPTVADTDETKAAQASIDTEVLVLM